MALLGVAVIFIGHPFTSVVQVAWFYLSVGIAYVLLVLVLTALRKKDIDRTFVPQRSRE